ncbi:MAG: hypothetical protein AB1726_04180 [Planctomycetota bacterium]
MIALLLAAGAVLGAASKDEMIETRSVCIWDAAPHCAFTDLIRSGDRFLVAFREAPSHVPAKEGEDGVVRVIASSDGTAWESLAVIAAAGVDLRDPKLSIAPDGRLMVVMGGSVYEGGTLAARAPQVAFSDATGTAFEAPRAARIDPRVAGPRDWLWRVTWHGERAWGVVYQPASEEWGLQLVTSADGLAWEHVATFAVAGRPNETTIRFLPGETAVAVVRREGGDRAGYVGRAAPPYRDWAWRSIGLRLGGPDLALLPDGALVLGTRDYRPDGTYATILGRLDLAGTFTPGVRLPSGGDTSYPGLLVHGAELWVSYYSSHAGKTAIYLARVPLELLSAETGGDGR